MLSPAVRISGGVIVNDVVAPPLPKPVQHADGPGLPA
jgi:hypothetical protein